MQNIKDIISPIKSIQIFTTDVIVGLTLNYRDGQIEHFGDETPTNALLLLEDGDYLTSITVWQHSQNNEVPTMNALTFTTASGNHITGGTKHGTTATYQQPKHAISRVTAESLNKSLSNLSMIGYQSLVAISNSADANLALVV